jgi:FkbM family methyltransferase
MHNFKTKYGHVICWENDVFIADRMKHGRLWEQDIVEKYLTDIIKKSNLILDIGAHIGSHTIMYSFINPTAQILAFEPQQHLFECLDENVKQLKSKGNIMLQKKAVGHINTVTTMSRHADDGPNAFKDVQFGGCSNFNIGGMSLGIDGERVEMIKIDDLNLNACDYMKIDVEGVESLVLKGAESTIKKFRPTIFYEANSKHITPEIENLLHIHIEDYMTSHEFLSSLNYEIQILPEDNFLAVPM